MSTNSENKPQPPGRPKYEYTHRKLAANEIGVNAPRSCTDIPCLLLFLIFWAAFTWLAIIAFKQGDLNRLIYGTDYVGNVCGHGKPTNASFAAANWSQYKYLYYPIAFDPWRAQFNFRESLNLGICVPECPKQFKPVRVYGYLFDNDIAPKWWYTSLFDTKAKFNRCLPNINTYDCSDPAQGFTPEQVAECEIKRNSTATGKLFDKLLNVQSVAMRGFTELKENWWILLACCAIAIVIAFIWLFVLRRLVKPVVVITIFLVFALLICIGAFFFHLHRVVKERNPNSDSAKWYLAGAIIMWILTFIYVCVIIFLFKDIMVACDIIEEASKVPIQMPTMMLVPPVLALWVLPFLFFGIFMAANIYTSASIISVDVPIIRSANETLANASRIATQQYQVENWRTYAHIANVFMFLWSVGLVHAIAFMILAFCAVFWYWSAPGDDKHPEYGVLHALGLVFKNHLGTLCFGSLIIAIVQTIRFCILLFEKRFEEITNRVEAAKFLVYCAQCCLAYLERFLKFINKNAYIVCCMTSESFIPAARHGLSMLMANALSVGAVTIIGEYVMMFGKLLITCAVTAICYAFCTKTDRGSQATGDSSAGFVLVMVTTAIMAYFIACIFINVFGVCIDVVLLSYCYDLEANNGNDKPFYFPSDLAKHVDRARDRQSKKQKQMTEMERPLNATSA